MFDRSADNASFVSGSSANLSPLSVGNGNDPLNPTPGYRFDTHSSSKTLDQAWQDVSARLSQFASDRNYLAMMNLAFGTDWNLTDANNLFKEWSVANFSHLPQIRTSSDLDILGARGAFVGETDTIYLSDSFLAQNAERPEVIADVLLEEIGHAIDARINSTDAAGDEGDIFSRLVRGEDMSAQQLMLLKLEDDSATVVLDGTSTSIEQSSTLEAARNQDGRLEEFAISADGKVMHRYQLVANGGWSGWNDMGLVPGGKELEVVQNQDGRLELFVIGKNDEVYQTYQKAPNGDGGWVDWNRFGLKASELEAAANRDGRLEAFAVGLDGKLFQAYQQQANSGWAGWFDFGTKASEIELVENRDGRLELFAIEEGSNALLQRYQLTTNGTQGWSGWNQFGLKARDIEVGQNQDGRLEAFAIGTNGDVFQTYQLAPNGGWSGWYQFGVKASEVEVAQNQDGRLELFAINENGDLLHRWQTAANSDWGNWTYTNLRAVEVESIRNADGRLEIFAIDTQGQAQSQWQLEANGTTGWSSWVQQPGIRGVGEA